MRSVGFFMPSLLLFIKVYLAEQKKLTRFSLLALTGAIVMDIWLICTSRLSGRGLRYPKKSWLL